MHGRQRPQPSRTNHPKTFLARDCARVEDKKMRPCARCRARQGSFDTGEVQKLKSRAARASGPEGPEVNRAPVFARSVPPDGFFFKTPQPRRMQDAPVVLERQ